MHVVGEDKSRLVLGRRKFLALGSTGLVALCFGERAWGQSLASAEAVLRPMSVGYLVGSSGVAQLRHLPLRIRQPRAAATEVDPTEYRVVPAESLPMGDTELIGRPLRMTIHGLYPPGNLVPKRRAELPLAIDLDVLFPSPDPMFPDPIRFFAWSFRQRPGWDPSPPVSFLFPLDWNALPEVSMRVVPSGGGRATIFHTKLTFDDETGRPRLQQGSYLLGTTPDAWKRAIALQDLGPGTPASLASVLVSMEPEGVE